MQRIMKKKRNGEIDILKCMFAVMIVLAHLNDTFQLGYFARGHIGVEFFFIVSGYYMANSALKTIGSSSFLPQNIPDLTWKFIIKKMSVFFFVYLAACISQFIIRMVVGKWTLSTIINKMLVLIPDISLTMMVLTPSKGWFLGGTWYLSAMLIGILIIYPVLLWKYEYSSKILFPVLSAFIYGWIYNKFGYIEAVDFWAGICSVSILRAFAGLGLGVGLFHFARYISERIHSCSQCKCTSHIILIAKICLYSIIFYYEFSRINVKYDIYILYLIFFALAMSFSCPHIGSNQITDFLGKWSLCLFIGHGVIRFAAKDILGNTISIQELTYILCIIVIYSLILLAIDKLKELKQH